MPDQIAEAARSNPLTDRETQVVKLIAEGLSGREIAERGPPAPAITKSPMKKNSVGHSMPASDRSSGWRLISTIAVAPVSATGGRLAMQRLVREEQHDRADEDRHGALGDGPGMPRYSLSAVPGSDLLDVVSS